MADHTLQAVIQWSPVNKSHLPLMVNDLIERGFVRNYWLPECDIFFINS
jgi:hypothetical protein